jgi:prepilin-type N-terminal cleavage/methylation domain-containing protein
VTNLSTLRGRHRGFTLVEMLVVIAIIGILVGLVTGAAMMAMRMAKKTVVKTEIGQLDASLKQYKTDNGEYPADGSIPPDDNNPTTGYYDKNSNGIPDDFERHFAKVFTRADLVSELSILGYDTPAKRLNLFQNYSPTTAMVFWLGGMPDNVGIVNSRLIGFSQNKINPLSDFNSQRTKPYYDFDPARLSGFPVDPTVNKRPFFRTYTPSGTPSIQPPPYTYPNITCYVYFRAEGKRGFEYFYDSDSATPRHFKTCPPKYLQVYGTNTNPTYVRPYWDEQSQSWVNPQEFQILFGGFDGKFGASNVYKSRILPGNNVVPNLWITRKILVADPLPPDTRANDGVDDQSNFGGTTVVD